MIIHTWYKHTTQNLSFFSKL